MSISTVSTEKFGNFNKNGRSLSPARNLKKAQLTVLN